MDLDPRVVAYAEVLRGLSSWKPHEGQIRVGQAYFNRHLRSIFVQCGRKWGKTDLALYFLWRLAQTFPGSPCYYIAPFQKQAKEIVWADPRVKNFGPRSWLVDGSSGVNNTELRLNFKNGSFIKIDGSDNYEAYRGPRFRICVYEEFKDHRPEFRRAMRPNAAVLDGLELFIGSPPERDCDYTTLADDHKADPRKFFYQAPTWENPHISTEWLRDEKSGLYRRSEGDIWEREYAAKFVKGGASKIFPMIDTSFVKPHAEVLEMIRRDRKKLEWFFWADPAGATCFGVLFVAINPYTKQIFVLDEIYETAQAEMTVKKIGARIIQKRNELHDRGEWRQGYDEAETWFLNEWIDNFEDEPGLEPSHKAANDKVNGLSLIKDIMLDKLLVISDRCKSDKPAPDNKCFYWELDNYFKDKKGNIPKKDDHLIDCFRYILAAAGYELKKKTEAIDRETSDEDFRGARPSHDFARVDDMGSTNSSMEDWN